LASWKARPARASSPAPCLHEAAPITLDGQLRLIPGVETFRRSSSLVANPSSQGMSLRGLGSTSASRTLVTQDDVPLNDAFGGWIHWEELPELSIHSVEVVRGGASDLYGSSAIGGVINVLPVNPAAILPNSNPTSAPKTPIDDSLLLEGHRNPGRRLPPAAFSAQTASSPSRPPRAAPSTPPRTSTPRTGSCSSIAPSTAAAAQSASSCAAAD
jgi:hypothetical protein